MIDLTGHGFIKKQLSDAVKDGRVGHAYIFGGTDGIGKTTAAKWFAAAALCEKGEGFPCGVCGSCRKIEAGSHPDVSVIDDEFVNRPGMKDYLPKAPSGRIAAGSVHAMRIAKHIASTKPFVSERKFVIIPDADMLNVNAQNALLKVFEEPPAYMTIVMISNSSGLLLPTITSRAVMYRFQPLSDDETAACLKKRLADAFSDELVALSFGSPGTALEMAENPGLKEDALRIRKAFFSYVRSDGDMTDILPLIGKDNVSFALSCISQEALSLAKRDFENAVAYINIFDIIQDIRLRLKNNGNFTLNVTDMLIRSWEELHG